MTDEKHKLLEEATDDELYQGYIDELSGAAARRRAVEKAHQEQKEREEEIRLWAERTGSPLPRDLER
jgi:hypothetical protein